MKLRYPLAVAFAILAWAWASEQDYQLKQSIACERKGGEWDYAGQICVKEMHHEDRR